MTTFKSLDQNSPKVIIDSEDDSFNTFIKLLMKSRLLEEGKNINQLRCKKAPPKVTFGNRFRKVQTQYGIYQGTYNVNWNGNDFILGVEQGEAKLVTEYRQPEYLKRICIFGESLDKVKQFVNYIYELGNEEANQENIIIYENNQGYWNVSKEKKPRKIESVIFKPEFIKSVLEDIEDFILSEEWYTEMGIPYKRSYLLYGPPGTGKSSFAQAIAAQIKYSICFVNCSDKINDFNFNRLLNSSPKKSIILIEDVDAIFTERKNTDKMNALTFSGFLNAIDGKLDPALLRPGRVDDLYEINYASKYQIEKLCLRFYKDEQLAKSFAEKLPENKFSMSMIQGFLLKFRKCQQKLVEKTEELLNSDQNVKIEVFLKDVNCLDVLNDFRLEEVYTLAKAKNLCKDDLERIASKLPDLLKGRLIETVRMDRRNYIKTEKQVFKFIEESIHDEQKQRNLRKFVRDEEVKTIFLVRDQLRRIESEERLKDESAIQQ